MHGEYSKGIKHRIRQLAGLAHERALASALTALEGEFASWRKGAIDAFALTERIHTFHDGVARDLWKQYTAATRLDLQVAYGIASGAISKEEAGPEVVEALQSAIEAFRP